MTKYLSESGVKTLWGKTKALVEPKYEKPSTGIPKGDLNSELQEAILKATSAYQKPSIGIPETDLSNDVKAKLDKASALESSLGTLTAKVITFGGYVNSISQLPEASETTLNQIWFVASEQSGGSVEYSPLMFNKYITSKIYRGGSSGTAEYAWVPFDSRDIVADSFLGALKDGVTAVTQAKGNSTTKVATTAFVQQEISDKLSAADAMKFKGVVNEATDLNVDGIKAGWTWKVGTVGTYAGQKCEVGDMIIAVKDGAAYTASSDWFVIQANIDGAVTGPASATAGNVVLFDGTTGKVIKDSGMTLGTSVPSSAKFTDQSVTADIYHYTPEENAGSKLDANSLETPGGVVGAIKRDSKGHVTGIEVVDLSKTYKRKQTAVSSPAASGNATAFVDSVSQDENGVVTVTKKNVSFPVVEELSDTEINAICV